MLITKTLKDGRFFKMALFSRKNIKPQNPFGLTQDDLKGQIKYFPMGLVVRMLVEQQAQGNRPDVVVFQDASHASSINGGFDWYRTEADGDFWEHVIYNKDFDLFFNRYPDYERYNLS